MGFFDSLFGKKKEEKKPEVKRNCPVCGKDFSGKGMDVHDGIICMDCWETLPKDFLTAKKGTKNPDQGAKVSKPATEKKTAKKAE